MVTRNVMTIIMNNLQKNVIAAVAAIMLLGVTPCFAGEWVDISTQEKLDAYIDRLQNPANVNYTTRVDPNVTYTGLIIDCRRLDLKTAMSPVVLDSHGDKLYGDVIKDYDAVTDKGAASYARGFYDKKAIARAGSNPVILKAVRLEKSGTCPVISQSDRMLLIYSNYKNNYLAKGAVVFVR